MIKQGKTTTTPFIARGELKEVKGKKILNWPMTEGLKELFATMPGNLNPWVFINHRTGKPYSKNINRIWNKACNDAKIKISLNNATRHSFACQMLNADVPEGVVSRLLRHSDARMIKRYGEYKTNSLKNNVDKVQAKQVQSQKNRWFKYLNLKGNKAVRVVSNPTLSAI